MARQLIPLNDHPSNLDRTARLITGPLYTGRDVYAVRGGYLATLDGMAFDGLFKSEHEARAAQPSAASPQQEAEIA